jgi:O-antigen ligase
MTHSRFSSKYIFPLLAVLSISFVLSLFLLQLIGGIIFILWLFEKWDEKKKLLDMLTGSVIVFGTIRLISIVFSAYPSVSYESLYKEALFYTTLVSLSFYLKTFDKKLLLNLILVFIIGAAAMSVAGIIKFILGNVDRAEGFTSGYTVFSSYLITTFGIALFYPKRNQNARWQIFWTLIIFVLFAGIVASLGRTNIAVAILMFIAAVASKKFNLKQIFAFGILFLTIGIIYFYNQPDLIGQRVKNITRLSDRDILWKGAEELLFERPVLGFGPRTFHNIFPFKDQFVDKDIGGWHNDFLQIYFESGVLGLISFIGLLIVLCIVSIKQIRDKKIDADLRMLSASILAALIGLILSALTAGFITSVVLSIVFVFLISILSRIELERTGNVN